MNERRCFHSCRSVLLRKECCARTTRALIVGFLVWCDGLNVKYSLTFLNTCSSIHKKQQSPPSSKYVSPAKPPHTYQQKISPVTSSQQLTRFKRFRKIVAFDLILRTASDFQLWNNRFILKPPIITLTAAFQLLPCLAVL